MIISKFISPYCMFKATGTSTTDYYELIYRCSADKTVLVKNINVSNISAASGYFAVKWKNTTQGIGTSSDYLALLTPIAPFTTVPVFANGFIQMDKSDELLVSGTANLGTGLYVIVSAVEQTEEL